VVRSEEYASYTCIILQYEITPVNHSSNDSGLCFVFLLPEIEHKMAYFLILDQFLNFLKDHHFNWSNLGKQTKKKKTERNRKNYRCTNAFYDSITDFDRLDRL
jgi:hypothetical protein